MRKRLMLTSVVMLAIMASTSLVAVAGNAHFIKNATSASQSGNNLVVVFKEAGLESGARESITVSVTATVISDCRNGGGNVASDPKKTDSGLTASGTFPADKNGNVTGTLTVTPTAGVTCPPGQTATIESVSYHAPATITDNTSGASISVSGF